MQTRIFDLLFGLCLGFYVTPTITVFGVVVPWALVGLGITILISLFKKLVFWIKKFRLFLWAKFIKAIKDELSKA